MCEPKFPVPEAERLPDDPLHPSGVRLQVSQLAVARSPSGAAVAIDLLCPRKTDPRSLKEVFVTRRFLLSKKGANSLVVEIQKYLDG